MLGARSRALALGWLILASVFFYAWWRPINVADHRAVDRGQLRCSARALLRLARRRQPRDRRARLVLVLGIAFNVAFLGYFKYANFAVSVANDVFGTEFVLTQIILPLGISFITFQKIAFLVDVHARRVKAFTLRDFLLFVLFFPQLIAGPIVHYREMMPQFQRAAAASTPTSMPSA